jgi:hypothetical protein
MSTEDSEYFRARAIEERARAADGGDQTIANIHLDLAEKYEALANITDGQPTLRPGWDGLSGVQPT